MHGCMPRMYDKHTSMHSKACRLLANDEQIVLERLAALVADTKLQAKEVFPLCILTKFKHIMMTRCQKHLFDGGYSGCRVILRIIVQVAALMTAVHWVVHGGARDALEYQVS